MSFAVQTAKMIAFLAILLSQVEEVVSTQCWKNDDTCLTDQADSYFSSYTCVDQAESGWASDSWCKSYPTWMRLCCAKACIDKGFAVSGCSTPSPSPSPPPPPPPSPVTQIASCGTDSNTCLQSYSGWSSYTCASAAKGGTVQNSYCSKYPTQMHTCCPKSCVQQGYEVTRCPRQNQQYSGAGCPKGMWAAKGYKASCKTCDGNTRRRRADSCTSCGEGSMSQNGKDECVSKKTTPCGSDNNTCLQSYPRWSNYTCASAAKGGTVRNSSCSTYPTEMHTCCPKSCVQQGYELTNCSSTFDESFTSASVLSPRFCSVIYVGFCSVLSVLGA